MIRYHWQSVVLILRTSWRISRSATVIAFLEAAGRIFQYLRPLFLGLVVTGLAAHRLTPLVLGIGGMIFTEAFGFILGICGVQARIGLNERIGQHFDAEVARISGTAPTLDHLQDPQYRDQMHALRERMGTLGMAYNSLINAVNNLVAPITTIAVAVGADLRLLLLLLIGAPASWWARSTMRWEQEAEDESATAGRRSKHFADLTTDPVAASELRVFGARNALLRLLGREAYEWRMPFARAEARGAAFSSAVTVLYVAAAMGILVWMAHDTLHGSVSPGQFATGILVVGQLRDVVGSLQSTVHFLGQMLRTVKRYRWLEEYGETARAAHPGTRPAPDALRDGLTLQDVSFRYPGADRDALRHIDLHLPAGEVVAVVGENGAGKSTLIGLLTGMYDVSGGKVLVDSIDLQDLSLDDWRDHCAGAFQDHLKLELSAREAIGVGGLDAADQIPDDIRLLDALDDAAASDVLAALPDGLDTRLGPSWPGGVDLSGGQWQRLAIGRAMVRRSPLLLVLDEPTSALDPATEHALFDRYAAAAKETSRAGGVTLIVTHRFSTVASADRVIVLADGAVAEQGTHEELMAAGGHYAELYGLQAAGYR
ncbi:ABC transporter permease [Flexivirga endophytica]|uniref:ABC transporter permease n=1 Tax=Flexivirga endophytica TaxID=1849103 RepID=A0A916T708_9MICO|nr:ABC transporter ATP-binding protein [Flexivirga endophytica]GGB32358.1 ABC transporter permease [Flexivirga endophytica]GHB53244.1 ABC transporter permease [Flexivirga endophytica]